MNSSLLTPHSSLSEAVYREYHGKVFGYMYSKINNSHDAEDLTADVFVKIYSKIDTFDETKASLSTWIYTVTRNTLTDFFRTRKIFAEIPDDAEDDASTEDEICNAETLERLAEALEALDEREELSDDELKQISGGTYHDNVYFKNESDATYIYNIGDTVEVYSGWLFGTVQCRIVDRHIVWFETHNTGGPGIYAVNVRGYRDEYKVQEIENHWYFYLNDDWLPRDYFEK